MITTRRPEIVKSYTMESERTSTVNSAVVEKRNNTFLTEQERRKVNMDFIMNYDEFLKKDREKSGVAVATPIETAKPEISERVVEKEIVKEEIDINPTSTTMQFSGTQAKEIIEENKLAQKQEKFQLTRKNKIMIGVYAALVTVVMSLIILNTSVLASLKGNIDAKTAEIETLKTTYTTVSEELGKVSSNEEIITKATEYGMKK